MGIGSASQPRGLGDWRCGILLGLEIGDGWMEWMEMGRVFAEDLCLMLCLLLFLDLTLTQKFLHDVIDTDKNPTFSLVLYFSCAVLFL